MTDIQTDKQNLPIVIDKYTSDGPGFFGQIEFHIDGSRLTQKCFANRIGQPSDDKEMETFELPVSIAEVVAVHDSSSAQSERILSLLDDDTREGYFENNPNYIDHNRVKLLQFANGQNGALIVYGEPCFFTLVVGNKAFEFSDNESGFYERDIINTNTENHNEIDHRP